jgi:TctA family transporter
MARRATVARSCAPRSVSGSGLASEEDSIAESATEFKRPAASTGGASWAWVPGVSAASAARRATIFAASARVAACAA